MIDCCETSTVKREAYLASPDVLRLRTTRDEIRTTCDQLHILAQEPAA